MYCLAQVLSGNIGKGCMLPAGREDRGREKGVVGSGILLTKRGAPARRFLSVCLL